MVADLGIYAGHWLRGIPPDTAKLKLYAVLIDGSAGGWLFVWFKYRALLVLTILTGGPLSLLPPTGRVEFE